MKAIRASNRLLFINLLCLLWLPNYCDIKENEADISAIQVNKVISSVHSEIENVPSKQEKEKYYDAVKIPVDNLFVESSVNNVNIIEKKAVISKDPTNSQNGQNVEETTQQVFSNLESSIPTVNNVEEETNLLHTNLEKSSVVPANKIASAAPLTQPEVTIKPSLSAPLSESSVLRSPEVAKNPFVPVHKEPVQSQQRLPPPDERPQPVLIPSNPVTEKPALESIPQQPHYDGMPSFDEWKKMMLAEQEKGGQKVPSPTPPGKKISSQKRRRNYSSYECGAKIVASNTESEGTGRILNELVDDYMLNPCKANIWFIIELCETVQATQIELANFELFSSCPREFAVYSSDNFPTRDWVQLGTFTAAEQRVLQSFELKQEGFGKFIKIELLSYYGKEHYCPLSVVRIFGTSMVDEYEEMETLASQPSVSEDDLDRLDISMEDKKSHNLFNSATDAVINIVKKAAQALGQHQSINDRNNTAPDQQNASKVKDCKNIDNSSHQCEDVPVATSNESLLPFHNISISPSSVHHSVFRMLHRCDQCVSSRIRYYSSAQPHCRFFQAAFGPVLMKHLCQWLKEHPLTFAHESLAHRKAHTPQADNLDVAPTKSPPPQIIIIPMDNNTSLKKSDDYANTTSADALESEDTLNDSKSQLDIFDVSEGSIKSRLEPSSLLLEINKSVALNDSQKVIAEFSNIVLPPSDAVNHLPKRPIIVVSEGTNMSVDNIEAEAVPPATDSVITAETTFEVDEEQLKEFIPETVSLVDDLPTPEDLKLVPTEAPEEAKALDVRSEAEGKQEPVPVSVSTAGQKESVFMRMSNRIKALELNMSLSSQYLQELSQRYRRQMEDMQRAFNRTIGTLNDTAKKAAERDTRQGEAIHTLQLQVANLTQTVEILLNERSAVFREMIETHMCLMVVEAIIMITVMSLCVRRLSRPPAGQVQPDRTMTGSSNPSSSPRIPKRRSSADPPSTPPVARKVKKRSASEEALHVGGKELSLMDLPMAFLEPTKAKKKNRKRSRVLRSASNPSAHQNTSLVPPCASSQLSFSDSCMLKKSQPYHQLHRKNHACENCRDNTCSMAKAGDRRRANGSAPLQNLTNGSIPGSHESPLRNQKLAKGERKFSFRKFLRFQKRDSI